MKKHVRIYGSQLVFGFGVAVFWYTVGIQDLLVWVYVVHFTMLLAVRATNTADCGHTWVHLRLVSDFFRVGLRFY